MNNVALTKTDRTKQVGAVLWLIVRKFFLAVLTLLKKINWKKISVFAWKVFKIVLLKTATVIGIAIGYCAMAAASAFKNSNDTSKNDVKDEDLYDPANMDPFAMWVRDDDKN